MRKHTGNWDSRVHHFVNAAFRKGGLGFRPKGLGLQVFEAAVSSSELRCARRAIQRCRVHTILLLAPLGFVTSEMLGFHGLDYDWQESSRPACRHVYSSRLEVWLIAAGNLWGLRVTRKTVWEVAPDRARGVEKGSTGVKGESVIFEASKARSLMISDPPRSEASSYVRQQETQKKPALQNCVYPIASRLQA